MNVYRYSYHRPDDGVPAPRALPTTQSDLIPFTPSTSTQPTHPTVSLLDPLIHFSTSLSPNDSFTSSCTGSTIQPSLRFSPWTSTATSRRSSRRSSRRRESPGHVTPPCPFPSMGVRPDAFLPQKPTRQDHVLPEPPRISSGPACVYSQPDHLRPTLHHLHIHGVGRRSACARGVRDRAMCREWAGPEVLSWRRGGGGGRGRSAVGGAGDEGVRGGRRRGTKERGGGGCAWRWWGRRMV